jgi:hypothetical protein
MVNIIRLTLFVLLIAAAPPFTARWAASQEGVSQGASGEPVDLELVLAVDSSGSIDSEERRLQRQGWAHAFTHPRVLSAIRSGGRGAIAVAFLEWAANGCETIGVKWTRISDAASATRFARGILAAPPLDCSGGNAIGDAIAFATGMIKSNRFRGTRAVIDVSGDGPNTIGRPALVAREMAVAVGITINALAIIDPERSFRGPGGMPLDTYYRDVIIGGPGSFVMVARNDTTFRQAALAKLVREIAGFDTAPETLGHAAAREWVKINGVN